MSKFSKLQSMLEKKGHSKESAGNIAAAIGRKKWGSSTMATASREHKSAASVAKKK